MNPSASGHVVVFGAGAVGSFHAAMLALAGERVTLLARPAQVRAVLAAGLKLDRAGQTHTVQVQATEDLTVLRDADLVLCCVKSADTPAAALQMAPHLRPEALLLSLQNGVDNADALAVQVRCVVIPAVVYVATAMAAPGHVQHFGRGDLVIGHGRSGPRTSDARLQQVADTFGAAGVPVRVSADVVAELWSKLLVNCAYNAISALAQRPYADLAGLAEVRTLQAEVVAEVLRVAAAAGVQLPAGDSMQAVAHIAAAMPAQLSSTAQDMARRKPGEIDHLNGYIVQRGRELGISAPANQALAALVKLVESGYPAAALP
ncbi:MAG: ketopantoate reductase family protein [Rubrivivax sp.]